MKISLIFMTFKTGKTSSLVRFACWIIKRSPAFLSCLKVARFEIMKQVQDYILQFCFRPKRSKKYIKLIKSKKYPGLDSNPRRALSLPFQIIASLGPKIAQKNTLDWIRTNDLPLRRRLLYPAELPRH